MFELDFGFNPTLVRLRRMPPRLHQRPGRSFNPTLVRLRPGVPVGGVGVGNQSFNPTLVRLRPAWPCWRGSQRPWVSIPRWFD